MVRRVDAVQLLPLLVRERCTHAYLMPPTIVQLAESLPAQGGEATEAVTNFPSGESV